MRRPTLLTAPYLAMWLWLIVPLMLHGLLPQIDFSDRHLSFHVGGWVNEIDQAQSFGEAVQIMWRERFYEVCHYLHVGHETTSLIIAPAEDHQCAAIRVLRSGEGRVLGKVANAEVIDQILRDLK